MRAEPDVLGHFVLWGRNLSVVDPLTLRTLDPGTGAEVDAPTIVGGDVTHIDRVGKDRLALTANTSADGPRASPWLPHCDARPMPGQVAHQTSPSTSLTESVHTSGV